MDRHLLEDVLFEAVLPEAAHNRVEGQSGGCLDRRRQVVAGLHVLVEQVDQQEVESEGVEQQEVEQQGG